MRLIGNTFISKSLGGAKDGHFASFPENGHKNKAPSPPPDRPF
jgi:hypothetical protein